jgi:hypothetical protein
MAYTNIDDPSAFFQTALYSGTAGDNNAITNDGNSDLQPDWVLFKHRTASNQDWYVVDSSRGSTKGLATNNNAAETTSSSSTKDFQTFNTDGFTVGTPEDTDACNSIGTHAAWQWKCDGGTTSSNTDGNTTTTVQANTDAGFSIVTYTGTGSSSQTMGHGLGVTPNIVLTKARSGTSNWSYNSNVGPMTYGTNRLLLNTDAALTADTNEVTAASSTTFTGGGSAGVNSSGATYVAYCFAEKQGYSKFGTYVGNAVTNGTFIYTGFKPACIITKTTNAVEGWGIYDNKRSGFNVYNDVLALDTQAAEYGGANYNFMDILSNGFKCRRATYGPNQSANYIYMAFAENPFVTSTGIPTTAR